MILERGDELFIPDLVSVFPEIVFTLRRTELTWKIRARTRFGDWSRTEPRGCSRFKAKLTKDDRSQVELEDHLEEKTRLDQAQIWSKGAL